jgi:hypothetical protein
VNKPSYQASQAVASYCDVGRRDVEHRIERELGSAGMTKRGREQARIGRSARHRLNQAEGRVVGSCHELRWKWLQGVPGEERRAIRGTVGVGVQDAQEVQTNDGFEWHTPRIIAIAGYARG